MYYDTLFEVFCAVDIELKSIYRRNQAIEVLDLFSNLLNEPDFVKYSTKVFYELVTGTCTQKS